MIGLYAIALAPLLVGAFLYIRSKQIVLWEYLVACGMGLLCSAIFHGVALWSMTADEETWSGRVVEARFDPSYVEWYMQAHTRTVGSGKNQHTEVYFTRETRRVPDRWSAKDSLGQSGSIGKDRYDYLRNAFKDESKVKGLKNNYDSGDPWTFVSTPKSGWLEPTTAMHHFENRVKACPSVFSFRKIPAGTNGLYEWPRPRDWLNRSGRLLGTATDLGGLPWDQLNGELGPKKFVNLIAIGFGENASRDLAMLQEAKWVGGKKNDLVLCWGGGTRQRPEWAYCFGWTESAACKRAIESAVLDGVNPSLIGKVREIVTAEYRIKDWSKFDYLTIEPPAWAYLVLVVVMAVSQGAWWYAAHRNTSSR